MNAMSGTSTSMPATGTATSTTAAGSMAGMNMGTTDPYILSIGGGDDIDPVAPPLHDPRFVDGTVGPVVDKGDAATVKVPDGPGFGGNSGRKQNAADKKQNNYSVTDANFNSELGLLAQNPDTGQPLDYVQQEQLYGAAGFLQQFDPAVYQQLVDNQNAGKGTVLGAAGHILGLLKTADPAETGVDESSVPQYLPGSPIKASTYIESAHDASGQDWARMHHFEASFKVYKMLINAGVDYKSALLFSGDDAVSGAGRLNGMNNQDGSTGLNADERAVYRLAAETQAATGIPIVQIMMNGHHMDTLDPSAMTNPNINKYIGYPADARDPSAARANAIAQAFLNGTVGNDPDTLRAIHKFQFNNDRLGPIASQIKDGTGMIDGPLKRDLAIAATIPPKVETPHAEGAPEPAVTNAEATGAGTGPMPAATADAAGTDAAGAAADPAAADAGAGAGADAPGGPAAATGVPDLSGVMDATKELGDTEQDGATIGAQTDDGTDATPQTDDTKDQQNALQKKLVKDLSDNALNTNEQADLLKSFSKGGKKLLDSIMKGAKGGKVSKADQQKLLTEAAKEGQDALAKALKDGKLSSKEIKDLKPLLNGNQDKLLDKIKAGDKLTDDQISALKDAGKPTDASQDSAVNAAIDKALGDGKVSADDLKVLKPLLSGQQVKLLAKFKDGDSISKDQVQAIKDASTPDPASDSDATDAGDASGKTDAKSATADGNAKADGSGDSDAKAPAAGSTGAATSTDGSKSASSTDTADDGSATTATQASDAGAASATSTAQKQAATTPDSANKVAAKS